MLLFAQHVLFYHMCNQTSPKLFIIYFIWSKCCVFFRFFCQTVKLLWIFKVLIAAIKPNSRLLSYRHGCHLWDVTDGEGRHRRVAGPKACVWVKCELQYKVKFHVNHTSILYVVTILSVDRRIDTSVLHGVERRAAGNSWFKFQCVQFASFNPVENFTLSVEIAYFVKCG